MPSFRWQACTHILDMPQRAGTFSVLPCDMIKKWLLALLWSDRPSEQTWPFTCKRRLGDHLEFLKAQLYVRIQLVQQLGNPRPVLTSQCTKMTVVEVLSFHSARSKTNVWHNSTLQYIKWSKLISGEDSSALTKFKIWRSFRISCLELPDPIMTIRWPSLYCCTIFSCL